MLECVNSSASVKLCYVCGKEVHTCADERGGPCPAHPNGVELVSGAWVCSSECWDIACG